MLDKLIRSGSICGVNILSSCDSSSELISLNALCACVKFLPLLHEWRFKWAHRFRIIDNRISYEKLCICMLMLHSMIWFTLMQNQQSRISWVKIQIWGWNWSAPMGRHGLIVSWQPIFHSSLFNVNVYGRIPIHHQLLLRFWHRFHP